MNSADDQLWDATLRDRDTYHDWADKLAEAIAKHFGAEIGEHSNQNCPWAEALEVIEAAQPVAGMRDAVLEEAALVAESQNRVGREWVRDSLWDNIIKRVPAAIRALKSPVTANDH